MKINKRALRHGVLNKTNWPKKEKCRVIWPKFEDAHLPFCYYKATCADIGSFKFGDTLSVSYTITLT